MLLSNASAYYMANKETRFLCNFACLFLGNQTLSYQNRYTIHNYNLITSYYNKQDKDLRPTLGMRGTPKKAIHSATKTVFVLSPPKLKAVEHIQPDSVLLHCKLFLQRRHCRRTAASLCRRGTNKSTRPARRKWHKNTKLKYKKDTE